jgi:hypothetical protein
MLARCRRATGLSIGATAVALAAWTSPTHAASPSPGWTISSLAEPTIFSPNAAGCDPIFFEATDNCDRYTLFARNAGSKPASGPVTIADSLPTGVKALGISGIEQQPAPAQNSMTCSMLPLQCTYEAGVPAGGVLIVTTNVEVQPTGGNLQGNSATISGGGAQSVSTTAKPTPVGSIPGSFGIDAFTFEANGVDGGLDNQAGDHPNSVTTTIHFAGTLDAAVGQGVLPVQQVKDVAVDLPMGFLGNPEAAPKCKVAELTQAEEPLCPPGSEVGKVTFEGTGAFRTSKVENLATSGVYNLVPEAGYPAEFGFNYFGHTLVMYANALPTSAGYVLRVTVPGVARVIELNGVALTFFGDPGLQNGTRSSSDAFFTNPMDCSTRHPLEARVVVDSWDQPGHWVEAKASAYEASASQAVRGCDMLQFSSTITAQPERTQADEPSSYSVNLNVPQSPNFSPDLATPELKSAEVTLPAGVSLSPSAAEGLAGCSAEGPEGINISAVLPLEGQQPNSPISKPEAGHCPSASQIGTVEIETQLLPPHTLSGRLYLAQPKCGGKGQPACTEASAANGELYGLYLEAEGSGVIIKLKGTAYANPTTGQLTTTFRENPQFPFSDLKIRLKGGARAVLANPQTCGAFTTTADLTPWSAPVTPDATPSSSFPITGCTSTMPFAPSFSAGTENPTAAESSPFVLTFSRSDGQQDFSGIRVTTPPGLLGMLSDVPLCEEPQAALGTCSEPSRIGTTTVAAGAGSHPFWISGRVYLTGPYNGAPFGLSVVVPAKAGPFNLGNVIVRSAINVDPTTTALTVTSGALPQIRDGVPFRLKTINVTIDRPGFILNPTNCEQQSIRGTIAAAQGALATVSSPFVVGGCASLPFKPSFTVSTQAKTSKASGASLDVKVASGPGQANIKSVKVDLPLRLPSRLTTLQKACTAGVFETNPANCPPESIVGVAKAYTPVLPVALTGPAYLVSHAAAAFPDLVVILQGDGVRVDLTGQTFIKKGVTSSNFASIPDVPVSSFELYLPEGKHSALAAYGNLCTRKLQMPTKITGQNGAVIKATTVIKVTGCPKAKNARKSENTRRSPKAHRVRAGKGRRHR